MGKKIGHDKGSTLSKLNEQISAKMEEVHAIVRDQALKAIKESTDALFKKHSELKGILWYQYTPNFADGDPCEFSFQTMWFSIDGLDVQNEVYGECELIEEEDSWVNSIVRFDSKTREMIPINRLSPVLVIDLQTFERDISKLDTNLETIFGDHTAVIIRRGDKEFRTCEISHD